VFINDSFKFKIFFDSNIKINDLAIDPQKKLISAFDVMLDKQNIQNNINNSQQVEKNEK